MLGAEVSMFDQLIESTEPSGRHAALVNQLRDALSHEDAISALASYILTAYEWERAQRLASAALQQFAEEQEKGVNTIVDAALRMGEVADRNIRQKVHTKVQASRRGRSAADKRHGQPGGSRDKREKILAIWSSGKYSSKDLCAEQEWAALEMSFSSARKALRGAPDPS